jgi:hypothetical protein
MKWFNCRGENYLKHVECVSLSREIENDALRKSVAVQRFQPMVIMGVLHEEFSTVHPYITNLMQMTSFKDTSMCTGHYEVPLPSSIKIVSFVLSVSVSTAYVGHPSLTTYYWRKDWNERNADLRLKWTMDFRVKTSTRTFLEQRFWGQCGHLRSTHQKQHRQTVGREEWRDGIIMIFRTTLCK